MQNRFKQWLLRRISFTSKVSTAREKFSEKIIGKIKNYIFNKNVVRIHVFLGFLTEKLWQEIRVLVWCNFLLWLVRIFSDCSIVLLANQKAALHGQNKSKYYSRLSGLQWMAIISRSAGAFRPSPVQNRIWGYYLCFLGQSFSPKRISKLIKSQ